MKWLAIGTGRCGTKSLVAWATQNGQACTHESVRLPFEPDAVTEGKIAARIAADPAEVSFMFSAHWEQARRFDPKLPIIVMHRDKFDTVASHIRICSGKDRLVPGRMPGKTFNDSYPTLKDQRDSWLAWGFWWDLVEELTEEIPEPCWHMDMSDLNEPGEMRALAQWLKSLGRWE